MRKRSELHRRPNPEPASEEKRTLPLPKTGTVLCPGCEEKIPIEGIVSFRPNKSGECPECGAEISPALMSEADPTDDEGGDAKAKHAPDGTPSGKFCGACGSVILLMKGAPWYNCGHKPDAAEPVDDPKKAKRFAPPGGLQTLAEHEGKKARGDAAQGQPKDLTGLNASPPAPKVTLEGNRLSIEWGKATFPIAAYSNLTVGGFFVSIQLPEGANRVDEAKRILAEMQEIADHTFAVQSKWYLRKLESLK